MNKQSEALRLADALEKKWWRWKDNPVEELKAAAELRKLYAECQQWRSVFGHLGTPDEIGNEWIALQDAVELKDTLIRQALEALDSDNPDIQLRSAIAIRKQLGDQT